MPYDHAPLAGEYDERIPGVTPADQRFVEIETDFVLGKIHRRGAGHAAPAGCCPCPSA